MVSVDVDVEDSQVGDELNLIVRDVAPDDKVYHTSNLYLHG